MGKPRKRVNPKVTTRVNRDYKRLYLKKLVKVVGQLPAPWGRSPSGRPPHDAKVVATVCAYMDAFGHTYESIEAELKAMPCLKSVLGVEKLPGHSVIHRGKQKLSMKYIRTVNKKVTARLRRKGMVLVVDSTGFRVKTGSTWYDIRIKRENKRRDHDKLHLVIEIRRGSILDFRITSPYKHDSPRLRALLSDIDEVLRVIGDSGYLSRKNCDIVVEKGGKPFFALKENTISRAKGSRPWKEVVYFAREKGELWKAIYHMRSYVEAVIGALKKRFGSGLRAIKIRMRRKQLALRVLAYNIKQALYDEVAKTLGVPYWIPC